MEFNSEQIAAINHPIGKPAVIAAGPGAGKTATLTERVCWLIEHGVKPSRICCVTFTNKAANELTDRVKKRLGSKVDDFDIPRVTTIHSLALSVIRKNPKGFGFADKITPMDEYNQRQMVKRIVESHNYDEDSTTLMYRVLDKISYHRARGVGFRKEYTKAVHESALKAHTGYHAMDENDLGIWEEFETEKKKANLVDFDDMVNLVVRRIRTDPTWLASLQKQFDHVLMDESQDTSRVQLEFINGLLAPDNYNLVLVGDTNQSIFSFNGSEPELLLGFSNGWRDVVPDLYKITRNHRSVNDVVNLSNLIQKNMKNTIPLHMSTWRKDKGEVRKLVAETPQGIASMIAGDIIRGMGQGFKYKDNVILVRAAIQIRDIEGELVKRRIPYIVKGGKGLLQTEEVRDILSYLRLAANYKDFMALVRAISTPRRGVGEGALEKIKILAKEKFDGDLIAACKTNKKLNSFCELVEAISQLKDNPSKALNYALEAISYRNYLMQKYQKEAHKIQSKLENIERLGLLVLSLSQEPSFTLDDLIFQLTLDRPREEEEERGAILKAYEDGKLTIRERDAKLKVVDQGSVVISTIHGMKGGEARKVFVTNVVEGSLPHRFSSSPEEIDEERRIWFVACTRARDQLIICVHSKEKRGNNLATVTPSRFLGEIGIK